MAQGLNLLKALCLTFGPSGYEDNVAALVKKELVGLCDEVTEDHLGNVYATLCGTGEVPQGNSFFSYKKLDRRPRIMISAHMDEVGFMVTEVTDEGYLKVTLVGGIDKRVLLGHKVSLRPYSPIGRACRDGRESIPGVILCKPIHLGGDELPAVDKMYIDIGAKDKEEAESYIKAGDFVTFDTEFVQFGKDGGYLKSKAIDDRLGCAAMITLLQRFKESGTRPTCDLTCAFTVREEIGLSGASCAAYRVDPDVAVVLESTAIADIADVAENSRVGDVGKGGVLSLADRSTIYSKPFAEYILALGAARSIPCQVKRYISGGNDAGKIHLSREGVRCAAISAPCRYLHTACNVIAKEDFFSICDLVHAIVTDLK